MKSIGRRELATGLGTAAIAAAYTQPTFAAGPTGMVSVPTLADVAGVTPGTGMTLYVQGRAAAGDGFQGLFVATGSSGFTVDGVLVLAGPSGWVWARQIANLTYLSSWWPVDPTGVTPCESALSQFLAALPSNSVGVLCSGTYLVGSASGWTPLTLTGRTNVKLVGQGTARLVANATPNTAIPAFVNSLVLLNQCTSCEVSDIHFDASVHSPASTAAFSAMECTGCLFFRLEGIGFTGNAVFAEAACTGSTWYMCRALQSASGTATRGFWLGNTAPLSPFANGALSKDLRVYKCEAIGNSATGISLGAMKASCEGCISSNNVGSGIVTPYTTVYNTGYHVITGNRCEGNAFFGYQTDSNTISGSYVVVSNNLFQGNVAGGILINNASSFSICGNVVANNTAPGGGDHIGITIGGNSADIDVIGNVCVNDGSVQSQAGIMVAASPSFALNRIVLANNVCRGNFRGIYCTVVDSTASIATMTVTGNLTENNDSGLTIVGDNFTGLVVTGNACRNNTTLDLRCTVPGSKVRGNTYTLPPLFAADVPYPSFANDSAAGAGGLQKGEEYISTTAVGALFIKQ